MNLQSCSLYVFVIQAVNQFGASKPIHLVQYTGTLALILVFICQMVPYSIVASNIYMCDWSDLCTEPAMSPQHIVADKLNAKTIRVSWEAPFKRTHAVKVSLHHPNMKLYDVIWRPSIAFLSCS